MQAGWGSIRAVGYTNLAVSRTEPKSNLTAARQTHMDVPVTHGDVGNRSGSPGSPTELAAAEWDRLRAGIRIMALSALRDAESAEEVAQESVTRIIQALREGRLRDVQRLGAFARSVAHHVIVDLLRAQRRLVRLEGPEGDLPGPEPDPLAALTSAEQSARIAAALQRLAAPDQEVLRLSFVEGLTPQELARHLGQPGTRIRKRKERALQRLRSLLVEQEGHESVRPATRLAELRSPAARAGRPE